MEAFTFTANDETLLRAGKPYFTAGLGLSNYLLGEDAGADQKQREPGGLLRGSGEMTGLYKQPHVRREKRECGRAVRTWVTRTFVFVFLQSELLGRQGLMVISCF